MTKCKFKSVSKQTIVITGGSSGIGLATVHAAAEKGARLVIASRNEPALAAIVKGIKASGGEAVYVVADVSDKRDVRRIAQTAIDTFGGFDTWINDAGTSIVGRIEDISDEDNHRLFDINFWGIVYGSTIALEHLKEKGGTIINLGSQLSDAAIPLQGMYSATKHAVKGFTDALRIEIEKEGYPVCVNLIKPAAIATPFFEHAKNYTEQAPKAPAPTYKPEEVATAILHAATHDVRELYVGGAAKFMNTMYTFMPRTMDKVYQGMADAQLSDEMRHQEGNLYEPGSDGRVHGYTEDTPKISLYTRSVTHPKTSAFAALGTAALAFFALCKLRGSSSSGTQRRTA